MTLHAGLFDLCQGVDFGEGVMAFNAFYHIGHHIRLRFLLAKGLSPEETDLLFVAPYTVGPLLMMTAQTFHFRPEDLSMFLPYGVTGMADVAVQYPCDMLSMGKGVVVNPDLRVLKSLVAFAALRTGHLRGLWQGNRPFGMTGRTGCPLTFVTLKTCLFRRPEGGWVMGVVIDIVMAGGAGVF